MDHYTVKRVLSYLLEVGTSCDDLMNKVFHRKNVKFAERLLDNAVVRKRNTLFVDLPVSALVDQFAHRLQVRLASERVSRNKIKTNKEHTRMQCRARQDGASARWPWSP